MTNVYLLTYTAIRFTHGLLFNDRCHLKLRRAAARKLVWRRLDQAQACTRELQ